MLIHLVPRESQPTIFYTINYPDPCERVPLPAAWAAQLQRIHADDIDMPRSVYALDSATWLTAVLHEVTFDLQTRRVTCAFTEGANMEWALEDEACVDALEQIVGDVLQVTAEQERERAPPSPSAARACVVRPPTATAAPPPPETKPAKHKKQRSLLMSLVSSFNKLSSVCLDSPPRAHAPPPPSPRLPPPPLTFLPPSRKLPLPRRAAVLPPSAHFQHRARATLVDTFRLFVLAELRERIPPGRYAVWAVQIMLRRAEGHMAFLVEEAGGTAPTLLNAAPPCVAGAPFFEDEDEDGSLTESTSSTDTDGSSVHTPVESPGNTPFAHGQRAGRGSMSTPFPRSPSPPEFSREDLATYTSLAAQCVRLRELLADGAAGRAHAAHEERAFLAVLEVKSRRRAWSNRAFLGGARMADLGLATTFRSSPLGRTAPETSPRSEPPVLEVCTGDHNVSALFPVTEEDEEETAASVRLVQDGALHDLESGLMLPLQRPPVRQRTQSMYPLQALDLGAQHLPDANVRPPQLTTASGGSLPTHALLYQPLKSPPATLEPQTKYALFDHPELDEDECAGVGAEFTLEMDLPPPYSPVYHREGPHGDQWLESGGMCPCR